MLEIIAASVKETLRRKPRLLITLGGLGPTPDDMTLKGVGLGLGKALQLNVKALRMVQAFYKRMGRGEVDMTIPRKKMASLPIGARPIANPVGTAPGVILTKGMSTVVSLPGVPKEMKAIFLDSIVPILKTTGGRAPAEITMRIDGIVESALAPTITLVKRRYPGLYFKSHPRGSEITGRPLIELHIYSLNENSRKKLGEAAFFILTRLAKHTRKDE